MDATTNGAATQLADTRPQLDTPLRVSIPVNAPARAVRVSRDEFIYRNAFSPAAQFLSKKFLNENDISVKYPNRTPVTSTGTMDHDAQIKTSIRDFSVLALSSKRAGNKDVEATAYASLGVIYDNQLNYTQAIDSYKSYLAICEEINDAVGSACACNCIGVDYMLMASPPSDAGSMQSFHATDQNKDNLTTAIFYHHKHLEIGPDSGGKFVANANLGLCLGMLGDINQSAKFHQDGLRIAIKMQTLYGQSIAVGNLGQLAMIKGDYTTAKTCFDQHLQLVQALLDPEAEIIAWKLLAQLSMSEGNYAEALENLQQAQRIAEREGHLNDLRRLHCLIGVVKGTMNFGVSMEIALREAHENAYSVIGSS